MGGMDDEIAELRNQVLQLARLLVDLESRMELLVRRVENLEEE